VTTPTALAAFVALLAVVSLVSLVARRIGVPYTVALVLIGLAVSAAAPPIHFQITSDLVLAILLPGLVFEAAARINVGHLLRAIGGVALLAVPGVLITAVLVAAVLKVGAGIPLPIGFVIGAMVSPTDPVAVIDAARRLRIPKRLETLFEAESLFNDGTAIVVFVLALGAVGGELSLVGGVVSFVTIVAGSLVIGLVGGFVFSRVLGEVEDHLIELTVTVLLAYGTYVVADLLHESGIIATVTAGIVLGSYGRRVGLSAAARETIDVVWGWLGFLFTALVFLLIGLAMTPHQLVDAAVPIAWAVLAITVGRALAVYVLLGGASVLAERAGLVTGHLPAGWLHLMFWGGLRGAVAVALALALPFDFPERAQVQGIVFGVVLFTLLVQGTTAGRVLRWAGVRRVSP
jgi:CPA1 family monovalent cation:H+ antiporter